MASHRSGAKRRQRHHFPVAIDVTKGLDMTAPLDDNDAALMFVPRSKQQDDFSRVVAGVTGDGGGVWILSGNHDCDAPRCQAGGQNENEGIL